ncbi:VOC family protein [Parvularcula maris]|uniref:VOC family protein n=1 Tax=Parvularcula maris TaxID=2965077 RepID=A0A9X2LAJ6_9PROT|nr:VOC family protein [Parvularcula maris]MCQ8186087.1 VOC family protein [Parvularcula maris]
MTGKPQGAQWASNYIVCADLEACAKTYEEAFGFELRSSEKDGEGKLAHTEWGHKDAVIFMAGTEQRGEKAPSSLGIERMPVTFYIYVEDLDAQFEKVRGAGVKVDGEPQDMPWGDRAFTATCPSGYAWMFAEKA